MVIVQLGMIGPSLAADFGVMAPAPIEGDEASSYLARRTVLHQLRAMFDLVRTEDLQSPVAADAQQISRSGITEEDQQVLEIELLTEGSYLLTSLKYLIEVGGAAWPSDRVEAHYVNDALLILSALARDFVRVMAEGGDPLVLMQQADEIFWQTEGYTEIPAGLGHFTDRDELVRNALERSLDRDAA